MNKLKKNDDITLKIDALSSLGSGIGRYDGMAVFADGTVPGDEITAHIIKVSKNYAIGKVNRIIEPSPERISSDCGVSARCGGCAFRHIKYEQELKFKQQKVEDALKRIGKIETNILPITGADCINRYRNKGQYPVSYENGKVNIGFYAPKSHRVIDCGDCLLAPEDFAAAMVAFRKWIDECGVSIYDEKPGKGILRHIYMRKGFGSGEVMACAVINSSALPHPERLVELLREAVPEIKSIIANINREKTNVILGNKNITVWGNDYITDKLCGLDFKLSPNSFYQINHDQTEKLYAMAKDYAGLTGSETVFDIYCGAGTIGLTMADSAKAVYGIEIVPQAVKNAKENAALNKIENADFLCGDAYSGTKILRENGIFPDVVILDPPRKGCDKELIEAVVGTSCRRIVYVSCDPATLARDLALFDEQGYKAEKAAPVDLFPRTVHCECIALITRAEAVE